VAKKSENCRESLEWESSITKRACKADRLLSVLRQIFRASEEEKWRTATNIARQSAKMPDLSIEHTAVRRKAVFVLWAEPTVFFRKEISTFRESRGGEHL